MPQHTQPIAYLGGAGLALGAGCTQALFWLLASTLFPGLPPVRVPAGLVVGAILFLGLGLVDDLKAFSPGAKFTWQLMAASIAVLMGVRYALTGLPQIDLPASCLWILVVVNAVNLTDVCDGLVGGLAVSSLLFLAYLGTGSAFLALTVAGASAGFLVFNWPPARIFLGDAGSHLLGFLLAACTMSSFPVAATWRHYAAVLLLVGVPLFELIFLTVTRIRKGLPWWRGSPDHFSLRLLAAGLSRPQADVVGWSLQLFLCFMAVELLRSSPLIRDVCLLLAVVMTLSAFWRFLLRWEVRT